ncbi:MAG: hypothetical protein E7399_07630 [Ruminococcaceae bacterium]|nr:hypothetical protein [Oscillospiraceae bacterium]
MEKNISIIKRENQRMKIAIERFPGWIELIQTLLLGLWVSSLVWFNEYNQPGHINIPGILSFVSCGIVYGIFMYKTAPLKVKISIIKYILPDICYVLNEKNGDIYKFNEGTQAILYESSYEEANRDGININAANWKTFVVPKGTNALSKSTIALLISGGCFLMFACGMIRCVVQNEMDILAAGVLFFGCMGAAAGLCVYKYFAIKEE